MVKKMLTRKESIKDLACPGPAGVAALDEIVRQLETVCTGNIYNPRKQTNVCLSLRQEK